MDRYTTRTMSRSPWGAGVARILAASIEAVEPRAAVSRALKRSGKSLHAGGGTFALDQFRRIVLVGAGKAGAPMAGGAAEALGDELSGGLVIVKDGYAEVSDLPPSVEIIEAGHPVPDGRGLDGSRRIAALLTNLSEQDLAICLISGGGSALLTLPPDGVRMEDLQETTRLLLSSGARIEEINTLRRHLDLVKGGGLARMAYPARVLTLILSDVVGDPLEAIASGPTAPDPTTFADALAILDRHGLSSRTPEGVLRRLRAGVVGAEPENPAPGDPLFERVQNILIGSNRQAAEAAVRQAEEEGYRAMLLTTCLEGEAREAGRLLASLARGMASEGVPVPRPGLIVAGGETTVRVAGNGLGGRNLEMALGAVRPLAGVSHVGFATLATDGGDGPTGAAGAFVTGETLARAAAMDLAPEEFLKRNDSYHFFEPLEDLLKPGPTLTNVNDLAFVFAF
ncbi:MAG TPA: glycerate kinase [Anaerolineales bacterium]|nr:glycerate kinase [Anaerolineales bacterium]